MRRKWITYFKPEAMKRVLLLCCVWLCCWVAADGQAVKPRLMVIPSDSYCQRCGYVSDGVPDYRRMFREDANVRLVISEMSTIMAKRGFPLESLEQTLKSIEQKELEGSLTANAYGAGLAESDLDRVKRMAGPDIILDLDVIVKKNGPQRFIHFNLQGLDAYTNKAISAASGEGNPTTATSVGVLLEEAVLNYMDNFNAALMSHFENMGKEGREVAVEVRIWQDSPVNMNTEYEFMGEQVTLGDVVDYWMSENCVEGRFSRVGGSDNQITYKQVRIPLFKTVLGKQRAINTRGFVNGLRQFLAGEPFKVESKIIERGLGEAWLVVGAKE